MQLNHIVTVQNLIEHEKKIMKRLEGLEEKILASSSSSDKDEYLRTKQVREFLKVSDNKLRTMREKGEIPFSFIGSTYYYPKVEILNLLKGNTIKKISINKK